MKDASKHYSDDSFWNKIKDFAIKVAVDSVILALKLYYALQDPDTPAWAKAVIIGALGYLIWPMDAYPDPLPGGYGDDIGVLMGAFTTVAAHIKAEHTTKAKETADNIFS